MSGMAGEAISGSSGTDEPLNKHSYRNEGLSHSKAESGLCSVYYGHY